MARRDAQLFEVLGARRSGGSSRRRRKEPGALTIGRSFLEWCAGRFGGARRAPVDDPGLRSALLFGGAAAMLAIGFLVGRWSVDAVVAPVGDALRSPVAAGDGERGGQEPGYVNWPQRLSAAEEEEACGDFCFVIHFQVGREEGRAGPARLAAWLRRNGVPTARIRGGRSGSAPAWVTVVYTADNVGVAERAVLERLTPPADLLAEVGLPSWETATRRLGKPVEAVRLRWPD